jgi:intracellular septation protein
MKFFVDIALLILFFVCYKLYDIYVAVGVTMIAYFLQFILQSFFQRKIDKVQMTIVGLVLILGSATLLFRNELFFKWKPSVIYWVLAIVLYATLKFTGKTMLQRLGEHSLMLPSHVWRQLNITWIIFFSLLGVLNIVIAYLFSTDVWVNFKLIGVLGLMATFLIGQGIFISKYLRK